MRTAVNASQSLMDEDDCWGACPGKLPSLCVCAGVLTSAVDPTHTHMHSQRRSCLVVIWSPMGWRHDRKVLSGPNLEMCSQLRSDILTDLHSDLRKHTFVMCSVWFAIQPFIFDQFPEWNPLGWLSSEVHGKIRQCVSNCPASRLPGVF